MKVKPQQIPEWWMALENLEQMHPQYLANLLQTDSLEDHLNNQVVRFLQIRDKLESAGRKDSAEEIAMQETLAEINQDWEEQPPLTPREQSRLQAFREKHGG